MVMKIYCFWGDYEFWRQDNSTFYEVGKEKTTLLLYEKVDFTGKIFHTVKQQPIEKPFNFLEYFPLKVHVETGTACW